MPNHKLGTPFVGCWCYNDGCQTNKLIKQLSFSFLSFISAFFNFQSRLFSKSRNHKLSKIFRMRATRKRNHFHIHSRTTTTFENLIDTHMDTSILNRWDDTPIKWEMTVVVNLHYNAPTIIGYRSTFESSFEHSETQKLLSVNVLKEEKICLSHNTNDLDFMNIIILSKKSTKLLNKKKKAEWHATPLFHLLLRLFISIEWARPIISSGWGWLREHAIMKTKSKKPMAKHTKHSMFTHFRDSITPIFHNPKIARAMITRAIKNHKSFLLNVIIQVFTSSVDNINILSKKSINLFYLSSTISFRFFLS